MKLEYVHSPSTEHSQQHKVYLVTLHRGEVLLAYSYTAIGAREKAILALEGLIKQLEEANKLARIERDKK